MTPSPTAPREVWESYRAELRHDQSIDTGNADLALSTASTIFFLVCACFVFRFANKVRRGAYVHYFDDDGNEHYRCRRDIEYSKTNFSKGVL